MKPHEQATADRLATRRAVCPACNETWWAPEDTASLEWECCCGAILRLEPCGCVREVASRGVVTDLEGL